jgi:importin subunit beta-1
VAYIGVIELTVGQWQDVIAILVNNLTGAASPASGPSSELLKEASLEAIGYICADIVSPSSCNNP